MQKFVLENMLRTECRWADALHDLQLNIRMATGRPATLKCVWLHKFDSWKWATSRFQHQGRGQPGQILREWAERYKAELAPEGLREILYYRETPLLFIPIPQPARLTRTRRHRPHFHRLGPTRLAPPRPYTSRMRQTYTGAGVVTVGRCRQYPLNSRCLNPPTHW